MSCLCLGGLWTRWSAPDGELLASCTIVTCEANELARPIHDRMPVVPAYAEAWEAWLDPALAAEGARKLLVPARAERITVRPANPIVNLGRHEGPGCLEQLAA